MLYVVWVLVSFFAVLGILECVVGVIEMLSLRRIRSIKGVSLRVTLADKEERMEYLLNTLVLMSDRLQVGHHDTILEIFDGGLSEASRQEILLYCEKNPWVLFTDE